MSHVSSLITYSGVKVLKLQVRSEGCEDKDKIVKQSCGLAVLKVDEHDYSKHGRGYNLVVIDGWTGIVSPYLTCLTLLPQYWKTRLSFYDS